MTLPLKYTKLTKEQFSETRKKALKEIEEKKEVQNKRNGYLI